ncbi:PREDICTED: E3 ubiquitin-protein ligase EL5-like isoform X2 [Populus euphratica]|uniref:E3 ubiquitin-protein ligase EL5-like isoform X2 n=1 Tax=Populus euphratica TaxID=75702 RepID=A0AAJ6XWD1_POPEU|nr:PREDICTED: E3 ubiquitin-protein ligase EL5-like isoform X2 [Populus euphratica]
MAGVLPGVECARRRRFHRSGDSLGAPAHGWTRRPSFCLYTSSHENHHGSISSVPKQRSILNQAYEDEKLGAVAKEAKERLDERLRMQKKKSEITRKTMASAQFIWHKSTGNLRGVDGRSMVLGELQMEVYSPKRSGSKRLNWAKLSWKAADQDECTICLDRFKSGETLVHLPCAHRYHPKCLVPWLENNGQCPCCRMEIHVELS